MSTDDELFTPEEVLRGFSAKRARLLLFQIESRTASLMMQSRRAVDRYLTEETAEQQDLAFFEALAESLFHHFHIQDLQPDIGPAFYAWRVPGGFQRENYVYAGAFFERL
jgi:hypothetical protein